MERLPRGLGCKVLKERLPGGLQQFPVTVARLESRRWLLVCSAAMTALALICTNGDNRDFQARFVQFVYAANDDLLCCIHGKIYGRAKLMEGQCSDAKTAQ